jgi:hypothetical protein
MKTGKILLNEFILSRKLLNTDKSFQIDLLSIKEILKDFPESRGDTFGKKGNHKNFLL